MLLVIVYVGAIAVLFLFVVMMLNVDDGEKVKQGFNKYKWLVFLVATILFVEIGLILDHSTTLFGSNVVTSLAIDPSISNTAAIGNVLYTQFIFPFQLSGMVLFVAMIGAIVLTLRDQSRFMRKQVISNQVNREKSDAVKVVKVESGKGIDL